MAVGNTKVVQVTNIAPQATKDQMHILFGYLGKIEDIRLYPTIRDVSCPVQSRICYIKFVDVATVGIAQHMTNTVFIDRALIVIPVSNGEIPDEYYALEMTRNGTIVPGLNVNEPKLPPHVVNSVQGSGAEQVIITTDPNLEGIGLPPYPPLPSNYDTAKIEETRRTILMLNVESSVTHDELINYFSTAGEVKYLRACTQDSNNRSHMLVEFSDQSSILNALKMNGMNFKGKQVEIQHATEPIIKPQAKSNEAAQKEIEEAMSRFKEAQNMINASIEPVIEVEEDVPALGLGLEDLALEDVDLHHVQEDQSLETANVGQNHAPEDASHSRTRRSSSRSSKSRRSRSKSTSRRSRQRSRDRDRSRRAKSRDKERKSRDRSRDRKRSRDRDRKSKDRESKEKVKEKPSRDSKEKRSDKESSADVISDKKRSRSRSKSRRRSRSRDRKIKERKRSRSRGSRRRTPSPRSTPRKRSRSRSRDRKRDKKSDKRDKDRKERRSRSRSSRSHSKVPRNYDEEEKGFDTDKDKLKDKEPEPQVEKDSSEKSDNMDISNSP
ncbi:hypothetical protein NQ314_017342 [Rhamnusium bicolor]|uniref:RRM domain-containing protein n=1 Tax=Rhamnusium bicolor TaxID=1586634 RepID=A0AAV8WTH9_9CUCU|nr:hypothetical protein NQ314_017342 [Rhamnusium bicolor]